MMPLVLVVEDNPSEIEIYCDMLFYNGFDVEAADDPRSAIQTAKTIHPSAILMDVRLPAMDGLTATSLLKAAPETADIPVICMSALDVDPHKAIEAGCVEFIRKPFEAVDLIRALQKVIPPKESQH
jgi:CheY-like chemotaxis protein